MQANRVGYITVTYADGGTESWEVVAPLSTDALAKLPDTLSKADGAPKT